MKENLSIQWEKCPHGVDKRFHCGRCQEERHQSFIDLLKQRKTEVPKKIPIKRGCHAIGGCFCSGACQEIIGYRDPLFEGETY